MAKDFVSCPRPALAGQLREQKNLPIARDLGILERMQIEQEKPNKPKFAVVVVLFAATILVVIIAAIAVLIWRGKEATKAPFTKHPVSMLSTPDRNPGAAAIG